MKGITPVVSVILLLLVTIAVVGFAFGFFQRLLGTAGTSAEEQMSTTTDRAAKTVSIDNVDAANAIVTIRNTGSKDIAAGEVTVFVSGALQSACSSVAVSKGSTATCDWSASACTAGTAVKVVAPGNEDSRTC